MMDNIESEIVRLSRLAIGVHWNEITIREEVLTPLLRLLGYQAGTDYDINREEEHLLAHPFLMVGSQKLRIDYAVMVRRRRFWVLEAKRPSSPLGPEAVHQACSYAIHPEVQARFFAVSNGIEFALFDVYEIDERCVPTLRFELRQLSSKFPRLRELLGCDHIRDEVARRALHDLEQVLSTELRQERLQEMGRRLNALVSRSKTAVDGNVRTLHKRRWAEEDLNIRTMFADCEPCRWLEWPSSSLTRATNSTLYLTSSARSSWVFRAIIWGRQFAV